MAKRKKSIEKSSHIIIGILGNEVIGFPFTKAIIKNTESIREYDENQFEDFEVTFRNGYRVDVPKLKCKCKLKIGAGKLEWGAEPNKEYYILEILEILEENR